MLAEANDSLTKKPFTGKFWRIQMATITAKHGTGELENFYTISKGNTNGRIETKLRKVNYNFLRMLSTRD